MTSLSHLSIRLDDEPSQLLLELLDGTATREQLLQKLQARIGSPASADLTLANLEPMLARMAEFGLLVS